MQFSYINDGFYVFMDAHYYTQYPLAPDLLEQQLPFFSEELEGIVGLLVEGGFAAIELPQSVVMEHRMFAGYRGGIGSGPRQACDISQRPGCAGAGVSGSGGASENQYPGRALYVASVAAVDDF